MTLPYDRKFNVGRQSEQLFNEELHKNYEATRHLLDVPEGRHAVPSAKLDGSIWLDRSENQLKSWNKSTNTWVPIFESKFQIVDQITNQLPPENPVIGQLWLYADVLMYYNGTKWTPVKALIQDGSQFNLSVFENFLLTSPLWRIGNTIIEDDDIVKYREERRKYLQGKLDYPADNEFQENEKWVQGDEKKVNNDKPTMPDTLLDAKCQLLVPNIDIDRIFLDGDLDFGYECAPNSKICITYPKRELIDKTPSLIHVNPGRLTEMTKTIVKVDRQAPKVGIKAENTEYYGFRSDSPYGELLLPEAEKDDGGYIVLKDGIYLSYDQAQNFDYVLAVRYTFSWYKSTGKIAVVSGKEQTNSFYIQNYAGPLTVFTDGYNLEEPEYDEDNISQVVTVNTEGEQIEDYSFLHSLKSEYGYIRDKDLYGRGVVKVLREYKKPLLFVNGEAMDPRSHDIEVDKNYIYVAGAQINMPWTVIELYDSMHDYDMSMGAVGNGMVADNDISGHPIIRYDKSKIDDEDDVILFVDGLLVKHEDIIRDNFIGCVTTEGLTKGQHYILLRDKYKCLYNESALSPAIPVGTMSDSLVYINGKLICNNKAVNTIATMDQLKSTAVNGEVKFFYSDKRDVTKGQFAIFDSITGTWSILDEEEAKKLQPIVNAYDNAPQAIKFNLTLDAQNDDIRIFGFNYANAIEHPMIIRNLPTDGADPEMKIVTNQKEFRIKEAFTPEIGALAVYVNGIRQYDVIEHMDGQGFELPVPVTGIVTYTIEYPEKGAARVSQREVLTEKNIIPNTINAYHTTKPMYPGRVVFYVNGIRQPQQAFTILDNYTLLVNDEKTMLVGNANNFPDEEVRPSEDGQHFYIHHEKSDQILVEVKQDYDRQENTILLDSTTNRSIDVEHYDLPLGILEASDEVAIYLDGLFTGLKKSVDSDKEGMSYALSPYTGTIDIKDADTIQRIINDPLYTFYETHPEAKLAYQNTHEGKSYPKKYHHLLFEWR